MLDAQNNNKISFLKMSGAGNSFLIFDARKEGLFLDQKKITKIASFSSFDQLILLEKSDRSDVRMKIYNRDGSISGACGNATRCVASLFEQEEVNIQTDVGILFCKKTSKDLISVAIAIPKFLPSEIPLSQNIDSQKLNLFEFEFSCVNVGNPHAVTFIDEKISDQKFFEIGPKVENHQLFPQKTNVEFAQILSEDLIEVRVWERGAGETLACGTGACAVAILAMKKGLVKKNKITTRFKGGDLMIEWNGEGSWVIMTGGFKKEGVVEISAD